MKANFKGKIITGQLAERFVKIGLAKPEEEKEEEFVLPAKEIIYMIELVQTLDDLVQFANDNRKTVKKAYEKRLKELS